MAKSRLLNNVKLLYIIFFLSLLNLSYFIYNKDSQSIFLFAVIALIVYLFNTNMIIVLLFTMICVNGLILINVSTEGLENNSEPEKVEKPGPIPKIETIAPATYSKEKKEVINELIPLTKAIDGLDIDEVNKMIGNLNKLIERF
jgi:hypothetical protein